MKISILELLLIIDDTIKKYGAVIITKNEDGGWKITAGIAVEHDKPSCSAENNDQIEFGNNSNVGDKK